MQKNWNNEQERLRRLRERQLADRDPREKQRQVQGYVTRREHLSRKRLTLAGIWADIPHAWKGAFFGLLLGLLGLLVIPSVWISAWALPVAAIVAVVCLVIAIMIGRGMDLRDEIRHLSR